ncbi:MAG: hypothetical protein GY854_15070 [Deltaproteobacteria bacterium]|nr:hypothetical protein [Deltaproteobacteria bacterium]
MKVLIAAFVVLVATPALAQKFKSQDAKATIQLREKHTIESIEKANAGRAEIAVKNPAYKKITLTALPKKNNKTDSVAFLAGANTRRTSLLDRAQKTQIREISAAVKARKLEDARRTWKAFLGSLKNQGKPLNLDDLIAHVIVSALFSEEAGNLKAVRGHLAKRSDPNTTGKTGSMIQRALVSFGESVSRIHSLTESTMKILHSEAAAILGSLK